MRISTTVNFFVKQPDGTMEPYYEELVHYHKLGFRVLDCIFCNATEADSPLRSKDWLAWGERIAEKSQQLGITYTQCHLPYYNFADPATGLNHDLEELARRSLIIASLLGAKWIAGHPATAFGSLEVPKASKAVNYEYFSRYVELGAQHNIGIAIENMADFPGQDYKRSYCATVEELVDLTDSIGGEHVGICWDFGHANLMYADQNDCLRLIGNRLKALHIHDNRGSGDDHLPIFFGNIKWEPLVHTLREIDYQGEFSFEVKRIPVYLPESVRSMQWLYIKAAAEYLLSL